MIIKDFSHLSKFERFFYADYWPDFMFVNGYPVLAVFWNIFLLAIPFFLAYLIKKIWQKTGLKKIWQKIVAIFIFVCWILFLPNTAYIITDVRHISDYCTIPNFYRICPESAWMLIFFFIYATIGWVSFVLAINQMKLFIAEVFNSKWARFFVLTIIPLVALGVTIGLINRWNSWEIFTNPAVILKSVGLYFVEWLYFKNLLAYIIGLYILYFFGDRLFKKVINF